MRHYLPSALLLLCLALTPGCRKDEDDEPVPTENYNDFGQNNGWTTSWTSNYTFGMAVTPTAVLRSSYSDAPLYFVARSTDHGTTWTSWPVGTIIHGITFATDSLGFSANLSERLRTADGGHTWIPMAVEPVTVVHVPGNPVRLFGFNTATTYTSTDEGLTWTPLGTGAPGSMVRDMQFVSSTTGYAALDGAVRRTLDGGLTWETALDQPGGSFRKVYHRDAMNGVAILSDPSGPILLYRTSDAWATFTTVDISSMGVPGSLRYDESGHLYATNFLALNRSTDLGTTWTVDLRFPFGQGIGGLLRSGDRLIAWSSGCMVTKEVPL